MQVPSVLEMHDLYSENDNEIITLFKCFLRKDGFVENLKKNDGFLCEYVE